MKRKKWDSEKATVVCTPFPQLSLLLLIIVVIINIIVSFFFQSFSNMKTVVVFKVL